MKHAPSVVAAGSSIRQADWCLARGVLPRGCMASTSMLVQRCCFDWRLDRSVCRHWHQLILLEMAWCMPMLAGTGISAYCPLSKICSRTPHSAQGTSNHAHTTTRPATLHVRRSRPTTPLRTGRWARIVHPTSPVHACFSWVVMVCHC